MKSKKRLITSDFRCDVWIENLKVQKSKHRIGIAVPVTAKPIVTAFLALLIIFGGCTEKYFIRPTPQMDVEPRFWVRVLLFNDVRSCALRIRSSFTVFDAQTLAPLARFDETAGPIKVEISSGKISMAGQSFAAEGVVVFPDEPHVFGINEEDYRGKLKLILNADGQTFDAVNHVPIEPYLAGVIGAEMPFYWQMEALKAQTIAARTYCFYIKNRFGVNRHWDVRKTQASQVYRGLAAESKRIWRAVNSTKGSILVCRRADGYSDHELFPTYYSSTCGGHTENSQNVFGGDFFEPLAGVDCPFCKSVAKPKFFFWRMAQFEKAEVSKRLIKKYPSLKKLVKITKIVSTKESDYESFSRLTSIKLVGSNGKSDFLRAEDLRLTIDPSGSILKSTACQISDSGNKWAFLSGRGYGHGVGMCQYGAEAMARRSKTTSQILSYYYPTSKIVKFY